MNTQQDSICDVLSHYELLIDENNDPVREVQILRDYMDKWDGQEFIDKMCLSKDKSVLEMGIGSGRLAVRTAPLCGNFCGIDFSPKTIERAKENLSKFENVKLICSDFMSYEFDSKFDVIYSSLTFMHFSEKQKAVNKIASLLNDGGRFVLSIDKNPSEYIDMGIRKVKIYPDNPIDTAEYIKSAGLKIIQQYETEFANIFVTEK